MKKHQYRPLFKINLQLFTEGGNSEGSIPSFSQATDSFISSIDDTGNEPSEPVEPQEVETEPTEPIEPQQQINPATEPQEQPQTEPQQPQFDIQAYLDNMYQDINQRLDAIQNQPQQQLSEEELEAQREAQKEELLNAFYEDPIAFQEKLMAEAEQRAEQKIMAKLQQQQQMQQQQMQLQQMWENKLNEFRNKNQDADKYMPKMFEILSQNPHLQQDSNPYELAYKMAKFEDLSKNTPKSIEDVLKNDEFKQQLLQNQEVKKMILESMKNNQAPTVISGSAGTVSVTPQNKPKSFKDAEKTFLEWANAQ